MARCRAPGVSVAAGLAESGDTTRDPRGKTGGPETPGGGGRVSAGQNCTRKVQKAGVQRHPFDARPMRPVETVGVIVMVVAFGLAAFAIGLSVGQRLGARAGWKEHYSIS